MKLLFQSQKNVQKRARRYLAVISVLLACQSAVAQSPYLPDTVRPQDREVLLQKIRSGYTVMDSVSAPASRYTVQIYAHRRHVAMGTVVKEGILTKWSEIANAGGQALVLDVQGKLHRVKALGVFEDYDLALLERPESMTPMPLEEISVPDVGGFIIAAGGAGEALSYGVVSVEPRSLRQSDRGFLGVLLGGKEGAAEVRVMHVAERSAAAEAGIQVGDKIVTMNGALVRNKQELGNALQRFAPQSEVAFGIERAGVLSEVRATLHARPEAQQLDGARTAQMKRMGGEISKVREGFPEVLQSDMQIEANHCGGPVVDLDGKFAGVVIARSSRIKTYVLDANRLKQLLATLKE